MSNKLHADAEGRSRAVRRVGANRRTARKNGADGPDLGLLPGLLGYRVRLAQRAIFADFAASMNGGGISPGLFGILVIIQANPGLKQSELALAAHLDRSSIVPVVDKLEARGLVARRAAPGDRRVNGLWLTPEGSALLRKLKRRVAAHERRIASRLTEAERRQLFDLLSRISPQPG